MVAQARHKDLRLRYYWDSVQLVIHSNEITCFGSSASSSRFAALPCSSTHAVVLAVALFSLRPAVLCSFGCRAANHRCSITDRAMQPLFQPFRALGHISDDVPFAVQRRGKETFVTVSVGKAWQVGAPLSLSALIVVSGMPWLALVYALAGLLKLQAWRKARRTSGKLQNCD